MKGFVPTPESTVDLMVDKLFCKRPPRPSDRVLDPGCGTGAFIQGVVAWCSSHKRPLPQIFGIESDPRHVPGARSRFGQCTQIQILQQDFFSSEIGQFDFIVGNPPYVPITELSVQERQTYREQFATARGRFDLYILFFEQALKMLKKGGRLVFITPEKFMYVKTAEPLRRIIAAMHVDEIQQVDEETFGGLVTYPTITTISNSNNHEKSLIVLRNGLKRVVNLPADGSSWLPHLFPCENVQSELTLRDVSLRVSCGVATGADSVFIRRTESLDKCLLPFALPTIAGRDLPPQSGGLATECSILIPYIKTGRLMEENQLGHLRAYLSDPPIRSRLMKRTCVRKKPWYAFHDNFPGSEMLVPKILCKDIASEPKFWIDEKGEFVPRHSVYYIVPKSQESIERLCEYLNSDSARRWLESNCQRAANGFIRLQSNILKDLPIPPGICSSNSSGLHGQTEARASGEM